MWHCHACFTFEPKFHSICVPSLPLPSRPLLLLIAQPIPWPFFGSQLRPFLLTVGGSESEFGADASARPSLLSFGVLSEFLSLLPLVRSKRNEQFVRYSWSPLAVSSYRTSYYIGGVALLCSWERSTIYSWYDFDTVRRLHHTNRNPNSKCWRGNTRSTQSIAAIVPWGYISQSE